jgi:hypothetical protein
MIVRTILTFAIAMLICGCSGEKPKLVAMTGKVVFNDKPVTGGSLFLVPDTQNAFQRDKPSSLLQLDGSFTIKTFPYGDGIPPGIYKVCLAPEVANRLKKPNYSDPAKTPWSVEVPDAGLADVLLEVK